MDTIEKIFGKKREDYDVDLNKALTLGQVIAILKKAPQDKVVKHGFSYPHSYRGYYDCLAFIPAMHTCVETMLDHAKHSVDCTFTGWKGGDFTMGKDTKVYLANVGRTGKPLTERKLLSMLGSKKEKVEPLPRTGKKRSVKAIVQDIRQRFYWVVVHTVCGISGVYTTVTSPALFRTEEEAEHMANKDPGDNGAYYVLKVEMGSFSTKQMKGTECLKGKQSS